MKGSWNRFKKVWSGSDPPPSHEAGPRRPPLGGIPSSRTLATQNALVVEPTAVVSDGNAAQNAAAPAAASGVNERVAHADASSYLDSPEAADSPASAEGSPQAAPKGPRVSVRLATWGDDWPGWQSGLAAGG